ncbi:hypothetical protein CC2G_011434 [Coprinopsis cinerea AmutBmut pab1-1]|nr:hypothetical protein CC2G_011434 [Coprinopsis cinerea AmutBmut pab1-1]
MSTNTVPPWPSLYNPGLEILNVNNREPTQPGGFYLYRGGDVFRFTFYWSLIFYTPFFLVCGAYAFWNYTFPPSSRLPRRLSVSRDSVAYQLVELSHTPTSPTTPAPTKLPRVNERRSRLAFAVIVLFIFLISSLGGSVLGSALLGFITTALYKAGGFHMSTWVESAPLHDTGFFTYAPQMGSVPARSPSGPHRFTEASPPCTQLVHSHSYL